MDLRSLALMRVGTAFIVLYDLCYRAQDLTAHYTDIGVLPRAVFITLYHPAQWSLFLINGTPLFSAALFLSAALFAIMLLFGYRTRIATIALAIFWVSLLTRNPLILQGGDRILGTVLFWGMFLPWGALFSVDSYRKGLPDGENKNHFITTAGTIAYTLQIVFIYWFAVLSKPVLVWFTHSAGVYYALLIGQYAKPLAEKLLEFPRLIAFSSRAAYGIEWIAPFFLFMPRRPNFFRFVALALLLVLHISFYATLYLGIFVWVCLVMLTGLIPSVFWDWIFKKLETSDRSELKIYFDNCCGSCRNIAYFIKTFFLLPKTQIIPAQHVESIEKEMMEKNSWVVVDASGKKYFAFDGVMAVMSVSPILFPFAYVSRIKPIRRFGDWMYYAVARQRTRICSIIPEDKAVPPPPDYRLPWYANVLVTFFITYIFLWGVAVASPAVMKHMYPFRGIGLFFQINQGWTMFNNPMRNGGWYVFSGELENGQTIDPFYDKPVSFDKPANVASTYKNSHWRSYFIKMIKSKQAQVQFTRYLCRAWNAEHTGTSRLKNLEIIYMEEYSLPNYQPRTIERKSLWKDYCK